MSAYYNEFDPKAAAWLRELIADGLIAPGEVDERDIRDVTPNDLRSFRQVHLFAGIGGWSAALRKAGWPDEQEVWTASCPCQPFSAAGGRGGFADERHLWPAAYHLVSQCRAPVLLGEQSSSKDGLTWFDLVSADMEAAEYTGGAIDLCSAGFAAPNLRQRLYFVWVGDTGSERAWRDAGAASGTEEGLPGSRHTDGRCGDALVVASAASELADTLRPGRPEGWAIAGEGSPARGGAPCRLAYPNGGNAGTEGLQRSGQQGQRPQDAGDSGSRFSGATNGFWRAADWVLCRDPDGPAWRPVEPGSFPLAPSLPGRVALLRGAGNAINLEVASGFVEAVIEVRAQAERLAA